MSKTIYIWLLLGVLFLFSLPARSVQAIGADIHGLNFTCGDSKANTEEGMQCCTLPYVDLDLSIGGIPGSDTLTSIVNGLFHYLPVFSREKNTVFTSKWKAAYDYQCHKNGRPEYTDPLNPNPYEGCTCVGGDSREELRAEELCRYVGNNIENPVQGLREKASCMECISGKDRDGDDLGTGTGMWTGLGCMRTEFQAFIQENLIGWSIRIGGLVALLCIIYSSISMQRSRGNPEAIQKARERLTSCILGLLLIIFAILLLRVVGVNILGLPGFA